MGVKGKRESLQCEAVARAAWGEPKRREGMELVYRCPCNENHRNGDEHPSLKINPKKNAWMCGPCGASGNAWELAAFLLGKGFKYESLSESDRAEITDWMRKPGLQMEKAKPTGEATNGKPKGKDGPWELETAYDYTDEAGQLLYQTVRYKRPDGYVLKPGDKPKDFRQRRPKNAKDDKDGWIWNLEGVRLVLYNLPEVLKSESMRENVTLMPTSLAEFEADRQQTEARIARLPYLLVVEGEKDVEAARKLGFTATCNPMGAGKWRDEYSEFLRGRKVVIIADADGPGRKHAQQVAASVSKWAACVKLIEALPGTGVKDLSDFAELIGKNDAKCKELLEAIIHDTAEWKAPTGSDVLDEVYHFLEEWLSVPDSVLRAVTLWAANSYVFKHWRQAPLLHIYSPEANCGKSTLLKLLKRLAANAHYTDCPSESSVFRRIDRDHSTMLLDEMDTVFKGKEESDKALQRMLNSVYEKDSGYDRTEQVGKKWEVRTYDVFCPVAFATIRSEIVPVSTRSRAIPIPMQRLRGKPRFREKLEDVARAEAIGAKLAGWIQSVESDLMNADPLVPDFDDARHVDKTESLLAIAEAAGGEWPDTSRTALFELLAGTQAANQSPQGKLLADMKTAFYPMDDNGESSTPRERIGSTELACALGKIETSPWPNYGGRAVCKQCNCHHITPEQIKKLLADFTDAAGHRIEPRDMRIEGRVVKGYERVWFEAAWKAYSGKDSPDSGRPDDSPALPATLPLAPTPELIGSKTDNSICCGVAAKPGIDKQRPFKTVKASEWRSAFTPDLQSSDCGFRPFILEDRPSHGGELGRAVAGGHETAMLDTGNVERATLPRGSYETRSSKK